MRTEEVFEQPVMTERPVLRVDERGATWARDLVATEWPLTLYLNGEEFVTLVASPDHLDELVIGFLASEGVITGPDEVRSLRFDDETGDARVEVTANTEGLKDKLFARRYITSCCGKGRASIYFDNDFRTAKASLSERTLKKCDVLRLIGDLQASSEIFQATGGVHNACLATPEDGIWAARSDIGRHNALDKLYGWSLREGRDARDAVAAFSGRVSSEIVLKVGKIGLPMILSKSAPTELGLAMADDLNITVVGFVRGERMNVYTHPERIELGQS